MRIVKEMEKYVNLYNLLYKRTQRDGEMMAVAVVAVASKGWREGWRENRIIERGSTKSTKVKVVAAVVVMLYQFTSEFQFSNRKKIR